MSIVVSVSNQKGGVGKTVTSYVLLTELAARGYKALGIDLDPQGNLSGSLGADGDNSATITDVLTGQSTAFEAVQALTFCDLISSDIYLAGAEKDVQGVGQEYKLQEALDAIKNQYDFIIIDTPPSLGFLTINAFTASDFLVIPSVPAKYSLDGIVALNDTIQRIRKYCNKELKIAGVLITRVKTNTRVARDMTELTNRVCEHLDSTIFSATIRETIEVENSILAEQKVTDRKTEIANDYNHFIDEFLVKVGAVNG